jgi:hypothetical protein
VLDAFNVLNHPVLGTPGASTNTPSSYGIISSTASSPRILQGSLKVSF